MVLNGWYIDKCLLKLYRRLMFDVIKDGWKHLLIRLLMMKEGAIINNNFDTTGLDVKIETFTELQIKIGGFTLIMLQ